MLVAVMLGLAARAQTTHIRMIPEISVDADPGALYYVQYTTNVASGNWDLFATIIGNESGKSVFFDTAPNSGSRFYRTIRVNETVLLTLDDYPGDGTILKQGTDDVVASYKIETSDQEMFIHHFPLIFDKRLWLYVDGITILDEETVIASRGDLTAMDFDELKVGSMYMLNLPVQNYRLPAHSTKHLSILLHSREVSDRITSNITILQAEAEVVDGYGLYRSAVASTPRMFVAEETPKGMVVITRDPSSPDQRIVPISQSTYTDNVPLLKLDAKSIGGPGTLRKIRVAIATSGLNPTILFGDVKLGVNGHTYSADSLVLSEEKGGLAEATFGNLNEVLPADQTVVMTVYVKVNPDGKGTLTGVQAYAGVYEYGQTGDLNNNPLVEDSSYNPIAPSDKEFVQGSPVTFTSLDVVVKGMSAQVDPTVIIYGAQGYAAHNVQFTFTLTAGNDTMYVSRPPSLGFMSSVDTGITNEDVVAYPGSIPGDSTTYFVIPAGSSRTFTIFGLWVNYGFPGQKQLGIWDIGFGTSSSNTSNQGINYGLDALSVSYYFDATKG